MTRALVPIAPGTEEMEAVIIIDVLRRAQWDVVAVGLHPGPVIASRGVTLVPDTTWDDIDPTGFDVIVLPGGAGGTRALLDDSRVIEAVRAHHQAGRLTAAVCAAPLVLQQAGILRGVPATCHPSVREQLTDADLRDDRVVVAGNIVTSQGPGTSFEFALALVAIIDGQELADSLALAMVCP